MRSQTVQRVFVFTLAALAAGAQPARAYVIGPPLAGEPIVVSTAAGDQLHARVSGDWVVYTSIDEGTGEVRYHDLVTGTEEAIPTLGGQDFLADVDGTNVAYTHLTEAGLAVFGFDFATGEPAVELDPQPNPQRGWPAIGGDTVAWADYGLRGVYPEIAVYDRVSEAATLLTHDLYNTTPRVSPDGRTVVWERCVSYLLACDIWRASLVDGAWTASPLAADPAVEETSPDTNGEVVVYVRRAVVDAAEVGDIAWRPVGGGAEHALGLPGVARWPSVSGPIVAFGYLPPGGGPWEIWVYDLRSDTLRQATFEPGDALLPDVFVSADGTARLVWSTVDEGGEYDVYARVFAVPTSTPADEIDELRSLLLGFGLPFGVRTSLTAKLSAAIAALDVGDLDTACAKLADFLSEVQAQSGKALTGYQAETLRAAAEAIRSQLGC